MAVQFPLTNTDHLSLVYRHPRGCGVVPCDLDLYSSMILSIFSMLVIHTFPLEKLLFILPAFVGLLAFLLLRFESTLYILNSSPLLGMCFSKYFLSVTCSFYFCSLVFSRAKVFHLVKSNLLSFFPLICLHCNQLEFNLNLYNGIYSVVTVLGSRFRGRT